MVKFVVDSTTWDDTGAGRGGTPFLKNDSDFPGAWIRIIKPGLVEIFLDPAGTKVIPIEMVPNDIGEFIVKMDTHGEGVTAFTVSIRFNPQFLEVLDSNSALPGVQVQPDPTSPFQGFELENSVNNQTGVIRYTNGSASPRQGVINLVRIKFKAGTTTTPADDPAMVIFKVDSSPANSQTAAGRVGLRLLKNLDDYVGAWIRVGALETTARISAPDTSNEAQQVTFDGSASTAVPGAAIVAYEWDFNDGTPKVTGADKATVTHTFADNGAAPYNVTLKVTDNATPTAGTDTATHKIDVKNLAPVISSITAVPDLLPSGGGTSVVTVNATDPAGANDPLKYSIDCRGNGNFTDTDHGDTSQSTSTTANCSFSATTTGISNTVKVEVEDDDGGKATGQKAVA